MTMATKHNTQKERLAWFEAELSKAVASIGHEPELIEAMNYSLLAGGKRIRPMMLLNTTAMLGGDLDSALSFAIALEMIHTYSLIHDDLPAMDNDSLRRGRPTSHVVFGEAQAILAGDALLNGAFEMMIRAGLEAPAEHRLHALRAMDAIGTAAGGRGMIRGQWLDIAATDHEITRGQLETLHLNKTGALFCAALEAGAYMAGAGTDALNQLLRYGRAFGMLFQMTDDILDVEGDPTKLGKSVGKDAQENKSTYVTLLGLEETKRLAAEYCQLAKCALEDFNGVEKTWFAELVDSMLNRDH